MNLKIILFLDGVINVILGLLLLPASDGIASFLGVPSVTPGFYPSILGAVLLGIGIALLIETFKKQQHISGLGLYGAVAINLCGGFVLSLWLIWGELDILLHGRIFLWILVAVLIILSIIELISESKNTGK
jgi:hypothetical protein